MAPRRRPLRGSPLLVSAAGAVVTIACTSVNRHPPGNLMAPPSVQICIQATPEAPVTVNGQPLDDTGCTLVREDAMVVVETTLEGYQPYREEYPASEGGRHITLVPATDQEAPPVE